MKPPRRFGVRTIATLLGIRIAYHFGSRLAPGRTVAHAARVFQTPLPSSRERAAYAATLTSAKEARIDVDGRSIATYVWGDPATQPYILFVHGWSSLGLRWESWIPQLFAKGWAAVAFDQRGHGRSDGELCSLPDFVRTTTAVARHYGNPEGVVAHSLGGTAVTLALDDGWTTKRVVLIGAAADVQGATRRFARFVRLREHLRPALHEALTGYTGVLIDELHIARHAPKRSQPVLVVHDRGDPEVPVEEAAMYVELWPGATLLETNGLGHRAVADDGAVREAALDFLAGDP
jgi:pimeloyl-ACP methyl ester carboxylesterase